MHVTQQIALALVACVKAIPEFGERTYTNGALGWDKRTYPMAVVYTDETRISTTTSGNRREKRAQTRTTDFNIEIHDMVDEDDGDIDWVARMSGFMVLVEGRLATLQTVVPIDDCLLKSDTGVAQVPDKLGIHSAQQITISVSYLTVEGDPSAFIEPNL